MSSVECRQGDAVRMAELSQRSGVPVATIKWWRREGLLPPGERSAPNQADYGESHLARLRLLTVLRDLVEMPTATIAGVVAALDDEDAPLHDVVGAAHGALSAGGDGDVSEEAVAFVDELLAQLDWRVDQHTPARHELARTVDALRGLGREVTTDGLRTHADAASRVARAEIEATPVDRPREEIVTDVVVGTILYDRVFSALRRLAHEDVSSRQWQDVPEA